MSSLAAERFWVDKACFHNAERQYYEYLSRKELAETETSSQNFYEDKLDNAKDRRTKPYKKPKKLKPKKDDCGPKDTSTTSETDEKILPFARPQLCSTVEVVEVVKLNTERNKKPNKSNKITETLFNNSQFFAEPKTNGADFVPTKCGVSVTKLKKTFSDAKIKGTATNNQCTLVSEIAKAREHIKNSLEKMDGIATLAASPVTAVVLDRIVAIEKDNADLRNLMENLQTLHFESQHRITELEKQLKSAVQSKNSVAVAIKKNEHADDDEVDLFGSESEEESEEAARVREERLASYAAKKSKKPTIIAKSNLILDVKPWDDQTDLGFMESSIRKIKSDGLIWGASKIIPVAYGIEKLSISCVVEDEKVSIDWLTEEIEKFEDYVQSVDIVAFNKI